MPISPHETPRRNVLTHMPTGFFFSSSFQGERDKYVYCMLQEQHGHPLFFNAILASHSFDFDCKAKNHIIYRSLSNNNEHKT